MTWSGRVGWCPSVVTPMAAGDGLLVRVKPTAATLRADALRALAEAAGRYGNGLIDLTNRGNLQIRGLQPNTVEAFAEVVRAHGLASHDAALEEVRNVAADPLGADDPNALFDSHAIARAIEAMLATEPRLMALPPKFGFLVDCSRQMRLADTHVDIVVRDVDRQLTVGLASGTAAVPCSPENAPDIVRHLAIAFLDLAGPADAPPYRMRELVEQIGEAAIFDRAGLAARADWNQVRGTDWSAVAPAPPHLTEATPALSLAPGLTRNPDADRETPVDPTRISQLALMYAPAPADSPVGFMPFAGRDTGLFVAGAPGGRIDAAALALVADLAGRYADATVRMTPWRAIALVPVSRKDSEELAAQLAGRDLITDPADPRRALRGPVVVPTNPAPSVKPKAIAR